jgi:hypothetical protein
MKTTLDILRPAAALALLLAGLATAQVGGKFYAVAWDGTDEHFITVDPATGTHTSLAVLPNVKLIDAFFRVFDPDSGLYAFIGGETSNTMSYQVVDAATGTVLRTVPRNDNLKNPIYDPGSGMVYGSWWSDSTVTTLDSLGHPRPGKLRGTEYFSAINPRTNARTDTPIPGVLMVAASSQYLDTDSGHYVFHGQDTSGVKSYYVIDVATGGLIAKNPISIKLDFPAYNPVLRAVHGLWWSDSTVREFDSLGRPKTVMPLEVRGAEYFVTVYKDSIRLVELPGVKWITNFNRTLDLDSGRYVFAGREATGGTRYYVVDIATGAIRSNALAAGNVNHLVYAPLGTILYPTAIKARSGAERAWTLRSAPFSGFATLEFANPGAEVFSFTLRDAAGRNVLHTGGVTGTSLRIDKGALKSGVYFFRLTGGGAVAAAGKLVIE